MAVAAGSIRARRGLNWRHVRRKSCRVQRCIWCPLRRRRRKADDRGRPRVPSIIICPKCMEMPERELLPDHGLLIQPAGLIITMYHYDKPSRASLLGRNSIQRCTIAASATGAAHGQAPRSTRE